MVKVITYGTFDLFHIGHLRLLERAKAKGDYLLVAISTDEFNWNSKKKVCVQPYEERSIIVSALKVVDEVIPEYSWDQKIDDIKKHGVDVFVMGNDWEGEFDFLKKYCRVEYLDRTPGVSTSERKKRIMSFNE